MLHRGEVRFRLDSLMDCQQVNRSSDSIFIYKVLETIGKNTLKYVTVLLI